MSFVVTCWERADLLALVCGVYCEFVTFPLVSWVRCGTWYIVWIPDLCTLTYFDKVILPEWYILAEIYWKDNINTGTGKMRKSIETVQRE